MPRSFLGFRGSEDLGGGLRGVFRLESYLRVDVGGAGRDAGDAFWAREASVGLSGSFGTTVLGRTPSPLWLSTITFNPFGESIGFSPAVRQYFGGAVLGDSRWNNGLSYTNNAARCRCASPSPPTPTRSTPGGSNGHNLGLQRRLHHRPVRGDPSSPSGSATAASRCPPASSARSCCQAGATYDFQFVRLYGLVGRIKTDADVDARTTSFQLGAAVPIGTSLILVAYGRAHDSTPLKATTDRTASIGYDHFLSKNTDIYVAAMYEKLSFVSSGSAVAGGVRVRF